MARSRCSNERLFARATPAAAMRTASSGRTAEKPRTLVPNGASNESKSTPFALRTAETERSSANPTRSCHGARCSSTFFTGT
jgi:hypothetical protein